MAALKIENIYKKFGSVEVLKGISLDVASGEFLVLVGPSGCGKSTLLNLIAGLETVSAGSIMIGDRVVNDISPKDRDIAMVFQSYALYPNMNIRKNLSFGLETRKMPKAQIQEIVQKVSTLLQIQNLLDRKPSELSGGQRQRVAMGRALARNPKVFLFDEPLSNLDAKLRVEMRTEIKRLHQRINTTIVYVTHDQIEAMTMADRIAIMKDGIVQQFDTPENVYDNPSNRFVAGFIGSPSMNFMPAKVGIDAGQAFLIMDTGNGRSHKLTVPREISPLAPWNDREVIFGIRPEQITEDTKRSRETGKNNIINCEVQVVEPTGPDTLVFIQLNGVEVTCRVHPAAARRPGETMALQVDMSKAIFFHPETGERI
ncbi:MAG: sn-glycerol-3-phosphate ABC transporter ATP-binding protein UgpC [Desulfobacteraceae bacterium]|nr:sn-glycerol-3-phosphate ABC transporter ATP-binding protein UgpC [Desulfobacteraceae bacterium]